MKRGFSVTSRDFLLVLLTSFALIFSFPPFHLGVLAYIALVPYFFYLEDKNLKEAFAVGYLVGLIWHAGTVFWIGHATIIGVIGALIWISLYFALFSFITVWLVKRMGTAAIWATPFIWISLELLASVGSMAFPWNSLAHTQTYYPLLIQYISITGMYGITLWIMFLNVIFYKLLKSRKETRRIIFYSLISVILILVPLGYGLLNQPAKNNPEKTLKISLVQGNIDPYQKWTPGFINTNFYIYRDLTLKAAKENPDLIIWPETAAPCYLRYEKYYRDFVHNLVNNLNTPLLTGTIDYQLTDTDKIESYNSVFLFRPGKSKLESYYKLHLVPFSERVPLVDKVPFIYNLAKNLDLNIGNYFSGDSATVFKINGDNNDVGVKFSAGICYDSVFPYLIRKFINNGAQFIVIITNDGWFGTLSGPYQHAQIAVLRAIENRVWLARCANTGVSEFIDPYGRIVKKTKLSERTFITHSIYIDDNKSFFALYGIYFVYLILFIDLGILIIAFSRKNSYNDSN